uniref:DUF6598 domain-containing protein n=1 Tax=Oryza brachyantha TaxID=4533 RepID=J3NAJ5_ORYBR
MGMGSDYPYPCPRGLPPQAVYPLTAALSSPDPDRFVHPIRRFVFGPQKMGISSHHGRYGVDRRTDGENNDGATKDHFGDGKENVRTTKDSEEHQKTIEYTEMATSSDEDASDSEEEAGMMSTDSEDDSCCNPPKIQTACILEDSSHRDGSIYKGNNWWKRTYRISDLDETPLEAMMLSSPKYCVMNGEECLTHGPCPMLHFVSLKLAEIADTGGPVELYGYLAARDLLDPLRNYIFHTSREDPIIVEKGSLIEISGPKRGIEILSDVLIEFDMRIKTGVGEDDLQLIDGVLVIGCETQTDVTLRRHIYGDCGAVEIKFSHLHHAVEATVQVAILEVQSHFNLSIDCYVGPLSDEMQLFCGHIAKPCGLRKFVLAAMMRNLLRLKLKVSQEEGGSYVEHFCSFEPNDHGHSCQQLNTKFASFMVKVTWSTLDFNNLENYM